MITLEAYFDYYNEYMLTAEETFELITTDSVLVIEDIFFKENVDTNNIYFRLLAQLLHFEKDPKTNKDVIIYLNYIIGYYVGLFLHPASGDALGIHYLKKAISLESSEDKIKLYETIIDMILEIL